MRQLEKDLYQEMRRNLPHTHWNRIENSILTGEPDVNAWFHGADHEVWLELKVIKNGRVEVRHSQLRWILHRVFYAGAGNVFIVARGNKELQVHEAASLWQQAQVAKINPHAWRARIDDDSITFEPRAASWDCPEPINWEEFKKFILRSRTSRGEAG